MAQPHHTLSLPSTTQALFAVIVAAVILQRLWELQISRRNEEYLLKERNGKKHSENLLPLVIVLQVLWFIATLLEVLVFDRPFLPFYALTGLLATATGQFLRYLSMKSLGRRWTLSLTTLPHEPPIQHGIYAYLRHPNWMGVILEIGGLPLIHTACLTCIAFSLANAVVIVTRMQSEHEALWKDWEIDQEKKR